MTTHKFCGIVYKPKQGSLVHLPLDEVCVQALVVDVSAKVTLSQVFVNDSKVPTPRAKYVFPVPARAAVCAFELRMEDGRIIKGIAKEKEKAVEEHANAIRQGRVTGLVEWATDDVFTISIGSIPAEQKLTTRLTYTVDLMNDDLTDQIRFQLPMCVGERYGQLPDTMLDASNPSGSTRVRIVIGIQTKGDIQSVISPSHPNFRALPFQSDGEPSRNRMVATYESPNFLTQDFVMNVQAEGLDEPRCFAEKDSKHSSVSMQLTLVPKFDLPPIPSQEYIFLVDRSGSMAGDRIETAKRTLVMLLRSLPAAGTTFNIFSFGTSSSKMFRSSLEYTQASLNEATQHVDQMSADYGGTEIRSALDSVFKSRNRTSPTSLFVLTDGEAYDIDATIKTVTKAVAMSTTEAPLRVFTLGIGGGASSAMCEGIARAGNGVCLMATSSENILGKCAKLVRASRTFILKNISVDWGVPANKPAKSGFGLRSAIRPRESIVLQSPNKIESLYPGLRLVVTAMIKDEAFGIPEHIILSGQRDGKGEAIEFRVPVQHVQPTEDDDTIPLVNTLAARRIITELEDPKNESQHTEEQKKATIIRFGEEYQLASRYTSFVAVGDHLSEYQKGSDKGKEKSSQGEKVGHIKGASLSNFVGNFFGFPTTEVDARVNLPGGDDDDDDEDWDCVDLPVERERETQIQYSYTVASAPRMRLVGGGLPTNTESRRKVSSGSTSGRVFGRSAPPPPAPSSAPIPLPSSRRAMWSAPPPPIAPGAAIQDPSILYGQEEYSSRQLESMAPSSGEREDDGNDVPFLPRGKKAVRTPTSDTSVTRLVRLQAFDGSFTLSDEFIQIVGKNVAKGAQPQGVPDMLWATAVAIAYIRKYLADQPELSDGLVEKAMGFVSQSPLGKGVDLRALVAKARDLL